jgi:hypothetical protein
MTAIRFPQQRPTDAAILADEKARNDAMLLESIDIRRWPNCACCGARVRSAVEGFVVKQNEAGAPTLVVHLKRCKARYFWNDSPVFDTPTLIEQILDGEAGSGAPFADLRALEAAVVAEVEDRIGRIGAGHRVQIAYLSKIAWDIRAQVRPAPSTRESLDAIEREVLDTLIMLGQGSVATLKTRLDHAPSAIIAALWSLQQQKLVARDGVLAPFTPTVLGHEVAERVS